MQETLICSVGGHSFTRERKRGRKPTICPDHQIQVTPQINSPMAADGLSEPRSRVSEVALEILTGDACLDPEFRRKLTYVADCLDDTAWLARRDSGDVSLMVENQQRLIREHTRRWAA